LPVVMISEIDRLRLDVFVDQKDATFIAKDAPVTITMAEKPGFKIEGHVARITGELDPRTKMLLTEIDIENSNQDLVAGSFVQVAMQVKSPALIEAPVEALVLKDDKTYLTMLTPENTLTFRPVTVASNDGLVLRLLDGAKEGETVVLNLGNSLPEGSKIRPVVDPPKATAPVATPAPAPPSSAATPAPVTAAAPMATPAPQATPVAAAAAAPALPVKPAPQATAAPASGVK
jgi:membrane fusion protein, multidrug efflux system